MNTAMRQHAGSTSSPPLPRGKVASSFEKAEKLAGGGLSAGEGLAANASLGGKRVQAPALRYGASPHFLSRRERSRSGRGFTLMEMMVTVAILALMIASFGQILAEAQDLVVTSQAIMKANARATALAGIIRDDVSRASKLGFLRVESNRLYIAIPGACKSMTSWVTGTGCIRVLGFDSTQKVVYRGSWILADMATSDISVEAKAEAKDVLWVGSRSPDFIVIQTAAPSQFNGNTTDDGGETDYVDTIKGEKGEIASLNFAGVGNVASLNDVNNLWPLLARNCTNLSIQALDDNLAAMSTGTWTKASADWPAALKITMTLSDPEIADRADIDGDFTYEIICPVRP